MTNKTMVWRVIYNITMPHCGSLSFPFHLLERTQQIEQLIQKTDRNLGMTPHARQVWIPRTSDKASDVTQFSNGMLC